MNDVEPKTCAIATVVQNYALYLHMIVFENIAFGLKLRKTPQEEIKDRIEDAVSMLSLAEHLERKRLRYPAGKNSRGF